MSGECAPEETCSGSSGAKICVPEQTYCDDQHACVQRSAGCVGNRCAAPLDLGATCSSSHQCSSGACSPNHVCVVPPLCCDSADASVCGENKACIYYGPGGACTGQYCVAAPGHLNDKCEDVSCIDGLNCLDPATGPDLALICRGRERTLGQDCQTYPNATPPIWITNDCIDGLYCAPQSGSPSGKCQAQPHLGEPCSATDQAGAPVKCAAGSYCGTDKICHASDGQDCTMAACQPGYRCATSVASGKCLPAGASCP